MKNIRDISLNSLILTLLHTILFLFFCLINFTLLNKIVKLTERLKTNVLCVISHCCFNEKKTHALLRKGNKNEKKIFFHIKENAC